MRQAKLKGFPGSERLKHARKAIVAVTPKGRRKARRRSAAGWLAAGVGTGAVLTYFFDPVRGKARRAQLVGRTAGAARSVGRRFGRAGRYAGSTASGVRQRVADRSRADVPANDQTLVAKVRSEVLGRRSVPKGSISVNAEQGIVVLRGTVESARDIPRIERMVRRVNGVLDVTNYLHVEGDIAENKAEAYEASLTRVTPRMPEPSTR